MEYNDGLKRIKLIMKQFGIDSQRKFALKAGISPQTLNTAFMNDSELKLSVIQDILRAFPEVSTDWFVMGEGNMLKVSSTIEFNTVDHAELMKTIGNLNEMIEMLKAKIDLLEGREKVAG